MMFFEKFFKKKEKNSFAANENVQALHKNLPFTASEQYRMLRTNIQFTLPANVKCPVIGVTSSIRGEGKSTTSVNLSYMLAEKGHRVLLIDADLRLPSIAKKLDMKGAPGLSNMLVSSNMDMEEFKSDIHDQWYILPAGDIPPNPSELLGSERMEKLLDTLKEQFDYIVIDLPPVNLVTDAISISNFLTGMIVVVRENYVTKHDVDNCFRQMNLSNVNILGFVMNESSQGGGTYAHRKNYKYYKKDN